MIINAVDIQQRATRYEGHTKGESLNQKVIQFKEFFNLKSYAFTMSLML